MRNRHVRDGSTRESPPQDLADLDLGGLDLGEGERSRGGPFGGAPATPPPYLESIPKDCDAENSATLEALPCKCKSWFCADCCVRRGLITRDRLIPVLKTFTGLQMWTLTIDPSLFPTPGLAFQYVRELRCVALLVRGLTKQGKLHTPRFFSVVEWQKESEMPHFHALFDATYIPFSNACDIWNSFRPKSAGPLQGDRPGFGAIRFSASKHKRGMQGAARRGTCLGMPSLGFTRQIFKDASGRAAYDSDGIPTYQICIDPATRGDRLRIFEMFVNQCQSAYAIARQFNAENVDGWNGWTESGIKILLRNPNAIGVFVWNKTRREFDPESGKVAIIRNPRPEWIVRYQPELAIVPMDLWRAARRKLSEMRRKSPLTGRDYSRKPNRKRQKLTPHR